MGSRIGTTLMTIGAAVGMAGVLAYATGFEIHLSPAIVSLLLVKVSLGAAGGLMIAGAAVRRRALHRERDAREIERIGTGAPRSALGAPPGDRRR